MKRQKTGGQPHGILTPYRIILRLALCLLLLMAPVVKAAGTPVNLDQVVISNAKFTRFNGTEITASGVSVTEQLRLNLNWDASSYQNTIKAGDFFEITLPDQMIYPNIPGAWNFELKDDQNKVIANGVLTPKGNNTTGGGKAVITFTKEVEGKFNNKGHFFMIAKFVENTANVGDNISVSVSLGSQTISTPGIKVTPKAVDNISQEIFRKWIGTVPNDPYHITWALRVNTKEDPLTGIVIKDSLSPSETPITIYQDDKSFTLQKILYIFNDNGEAIGTKYAGPVININEDPRLSIDADGRGFTFRLGDAEPATGAD